MSNSIKGEKGFQATHGLRDHPLYNIWCQIRSRVFNSTTKCYANYGGRGISIAAEFDDAGYFIRYVETTLGPRPKGATLDRIDNDKGYVPGNLRWASAATQNRNRRNTVRYIYGGEYLTAVEIANKAGVDAEKLSNRAKLRRSRGYEFSIDTIVSQLKLEIDLPQL